MHENHELPGLSTAPHDLFLEPGAVLLKGFAASREQDIRAAVEQIAAAAPFRHMSTPGGHVMSAAMSNCGAVGWVTDRRGYRYAETDPRTGLPWPAMPPVLLALAGQAADQAGYENFLPDGCLINCYEPGAKMALHQDRDERDLCAPIVSVSLGLPVIFLWGGKTRSEKPHRILLASGDVVVWGGAARLNFHGVLPLADGGHPVFGRRRVNLTFRKAL